MNKWRAALVIALTFGSAMVSQGLEPTWLGYDENSRESKRTEKYLKEHEAGKKRQPKQANDKNPYGKIVQTCMDRESYFDNAGMRRVNMCVERLTKEYDRAHPPTPTPTLEPTATPTAEPTIEN